MSWFKRTPEPQTALQVKQASCKHDGRFTIYGYNRARPPHGSCNDCGAEVRLDVILNTYFNKMNAILDTNGIR